jgi:hypothetical protein
MISTLLFTDSKGHPFFYDAEAFISEFVDQPNCEFSIIVERIGNKHTDKQRSFYFAVVNRLIWLALKQEGYELTETETHLWNKSHSPALKTTIKKGGVDMLMDVQLDFAKAKKDVLSNYIEDRIRFAAQHLNLRIPSAPADGESYDKITRELFELKKYQK